MISDIYDKRYMIIQLSRKRKQEFILFIKSKPQILVLKKLPYLSEIPIYNFYFFKKLLIISGICDKGCMAIILSNKKNKQLKKSDNL